MRLIYLRAELGIFWIRNFFHCALISSVYLSLQNVPRTFRMVSSYLAFVSVEVRW